MFFLIAIIFILQILVTFIIVSYLINIDMKILWFNSAVNDTNEWVETRSNKVEKIFSDIKLIIDKYCNKIKRHQQMLILKQILGILEWVFFIFLKKKGKKLLLGYKLIKALSGELSTIKNMV
mgnify:FL=1